MSQRLTSFILGNKFPEKVNDKNDNDRYDSSSSNESQDSLDGDNSQISDLLYTTKNGTKYKKRKVPKIISHVKYNKKSPRKLLQRAAYAFCTMAK